MRGALWFLGIFGVAVALALFMGNNQGTVTLVLPPYRIDLSLNFVLLMLMAAFALLYLAMRALTALLELPRQARRWRVQQKERSILASLTDTLGQMMSGRYLRARKSATQVLAYEQLLADMHEGLEQGAELRALAHLLAAENAHALQDRPLRDENLDRAAAELAGRSGATAQALDEGLRLRRARWLIDDREATTALDLLDGLPQGVARRTLALRLRLKAARHARRTPKALETARLLAKHRAFSPDAARGIVRGLAIDLIASTHDDAQLERAWDTQLDPAERAMPELAIAAAARLTQLSGDAQRAREWMLPVWERFVDGLPGEAGLSAAQQLALARALEPGLPELDAAWLARLESAAQRAPGHAIVQYLVGMACLHRHLWGKAHAHLAQAAPALHDTELRRRAWVALAALASERGDEEAEQQAWAEVVGEHRIAADTAVNSRL